jgi:hypothetical protein
MEKQDCLNKIDEMIPDMVQYVKERAEYYLRSGAIDMDEFDSDFVLPKVLLHVCLNDASGQYKPLWAEAQEVAKNLKHF